ncbi:MAG: hypothetical protein MZW92_25625 [Comamonadaceae bacterium]|nr:hypothetical protein [Comamonadaceae bacterium]
MVLAGTVGKDHALIRRLRTLTFGLLTPFYFIRAGSYVSIPAVITAPVALLVLFMSKMVTKIIGIYPVTTVLPIPAYSGKAMPHDAADVHRADLRLHLGAVRSVTHGIIDQAQHSSLVGIAVIGSAVVPTLIANAFFIPKYLLLKRDEFQDEQAVTAVSTKQAE